MLAWQHAKPKMPPDNFMLQNNITNHEEFMRLALRQAQIAYDSGEVPIGAVVVDTTTGSVIGQACNMTLSQNDPTAHAETLAIRQACQSKGAQRIPDCDLYVTLEPCPMCASAIRFARIRHVYFGATDVKSGGWISGPNFSQCKSLHYKTNSTGDVLAAESTQLLQGFFKERRA